MTTTMKAPSRHVVVQIDLRGDAQAALDRTPLDQLVADELRRQGLDLADSSRALVIGDAVSLPGHIAAYQRVRSESGFSKMLFLLLGEPPGERQGVDRDPWVLAYPPLPTEPGSAGVLWAGSTRGIGWRPGRSDVLTRSGSEDDPLVADALIEILTLPAIFDGVLSQLGRMPAPIAGLGLRLIVHDVPDSQVRRALWQAGRQLSGLDGSDPDERSSRGPVAKGPSGKLLEMLIGRRPVEKVTLEDCVKPSSRLRRLEDDCAAALEQAQYAAAQLSRPTALFFGIRGTPPAVALAETADTLRAYSGELEDALIAVDGSVGLESAARAYLNGLDIQIPEVPALSARAIDTALRDEVLACLDRRVPLTDAAAHLAELDGRIAPVGSAARVDELEQVCSTELLERMAAPRPFPIRPTGGAWAVGAAGCGLLAGLWPQIGLAAGPVTALLGAGCLALAARNSPERGLGGEERSPGFLRHAIAGLVGAAAGIAVGLVASPPKLAGLASLVAALALTLFLAVRRWTSAVSIWRRAAGIDEAHSALNGLHGVLSQAVLSDWLLAEPKYRAANRARALGGLLDYIADSLDAAVEEVGRETHEERPTLSEWNGSAQQSLPEGDGDDSDLNDEGEDREREQAASDESDDLRELLVGDLADLTANLVLRYLPEITRDRDPDAVDKLPVEQDVREAVARLRRHQTQNGIAEPPAFPRRSGERPDTLRLAGVDPARVRRAVAVNDDSPDIRQLCTRDQLRMLNREPGASLWVRFAHRSLQQAEQQGAAASWSGRASNDARQAGRQVDQMAWLSSSRFAGALRLTPLQFGAAKTIRAAARRPETEDR